MTPRDLPRDNPRIAFVHVPKCGGTTMNSQLAEWVGQDHSLLVGDRRFGAQIEITDGLDLWKPALQPARLVHGHFTWPLLKDICERAGVAPFVPVALVREPLARAVSEYHYIRSYPQHPLYALLSEITIDQFLMHHHQCNTQCQYLTKTDLFHPARDLIMADFGGIAPLDDIDDFSSRLAVVLGQSPTPAEARNVSGTGTDARHVDPKVASEFYEKNIADLRLYWWVRRNWRARWTL